MPIAGAAAGEQLQARETRRAQVIRRMMGAVKPAPDPGGRYCDSTRRFHATHPDRREQGTTMCTSHRPVAAPPRPPGLRATS